MYEEANLRQQPGEVNKCPSELRKSVFWYILASFLGILVKTNFTGLNSFFSALNKAYSFSNALKTFGKKAASKLQTRKFFLSFVVKFFNSTVSKTCFSQLKKLISFHT